MYLPRLFERYIMLTVHEIDGRAWLLLLAALARACARLVAHRPGGPQALRERGRRPDRGCRPHHQGWLREPDDRSERPRLA